MKLRPLRRLIWWLLPFVVARSLVPGGFMLTTAEHGLELVMCSGYGPVSSAPAAEHQHHSEHDHSGDASGGDDAPTDRAPCLYAVSGSPCTFVAWAHEAPPPPAATKIEFCPQLTRSCDPPLLDRIRGPPLA